MTEGAFGLSQTGRFSKTGGLTSFVPTSEAETQIIAAIAKHRELPTPESIAKRVRGMKPKQITQARRANYRIKKAWDRKTVQVVKTLSLAELLSDSLTSICLTLKEAGDHRRKVIVNKIKSYNGRPTFKHLANYLTPISSGPKLITSHPLIQSAAVRRLIFLLGKMSIEEIRKQRLDRKVHPDIRAYLDHRFNRQVV